MVARGVCCIMARDVHRENAHTETHRQDAFRVPPDVRAGKVNLPQPAEALRDFHLRALDLMVASRRFDSWTLARTQNTERSLCRALVFHNDNCCTPAFGLPHARGTEVASQ